MAQVIPGMALPPGPPRLRGIGPRRLAIPLQDPDSGQSECSVTNQVTVRVVRRCPENENSVSSVLELTSKRLH